MIPPLRLNSHEFSYERGFSIVRQRIAALAPAAVAAVHGDDVRVAHFLQVVGGEGGAITAAAVQDDRRIQIGDALFDVAFDDSLAQVDGAGKVIAGPLAFFANIDEKKSVAAIHARLDVVDGRLTDALTGLVDEL